MLCQWADFFLSEHRRVRVYVHRRHNKGVYHRNLVCISRVEHSYFCRLRILITEPDSREFFVANQRTVYILEVLKTEDSQDSRRIRVPLKTEKLNKKRLNGLLCVLSEAKKRKTKQNKSEAMRVCSS